MNTINYICKAKFPSDWTGIGLKAYNIALEYQNSATFFGTPNLPKPIIHPAFLNVTDPDEAPDANVYSLLAMMDLASVISEWDSAVKDFAVLLLRALGYSPRGRVVRTRKNVTHMNCGELMDAQADVCVKDESEIFLLVQEVECSVLSDPETQLIAKAIAAFATNNLTRQKTLNLPLLDSKIMAGITLKGTTPIFYKIKVTNALVANVARGTCPQETTIVHAHKPRIPRPNEGVKPLENRLAILSCFEAFKRFLD